jgi:malonyl CoA-acyl carrier protein transacylase
MASQSCARRLSLAVLAAYPTAAAVAGADRADLERLVAGASQGQIGAARVDALVAAADLVRSRSELVAENALLRQQLIVLARSVTRPRIARTDRPLAAGVLGQGDA